MQNQFERFWTIEEAYPQVKYSRDEINCENHFVENTYRNSSDDLLTGSTDVATLIQIQRNLVRILNNSGFELRKFSSNSNEVLTEMLNDVKQNQSEIKNYIIKVDLNYPNNLHDLHRDLPLCPEHRTPPNSKLSKLMTTLYDKKRYIIHYRNLKQCLNSGLRLKKIHRILKFRQSAWNGVAIIYDLYRRRDSSNEGGCGVTAGYGLALDVKRCLPNLSIGIVNALRTSISPYDKSTLRLSSKQNTMFLNGRFCVNDPTHITPHSSTLIDPVFISKPDIIVSTKNTNVDHISDHRLVICEFSIKVFKTSQKMHTYRNIKNFDPDSFFNDLIQIPWDHIFYIDNIDKKVEFFII
ncbi:hypothetical protein NQ317_005804 [Molorchus minor]|uniref:Endonuclease/exonuclease/phosphatase domain-containing protein n=1 Tax=Molorchus minor TaxID=1323400 RepID=A0ABQ9JKG5_9CUCU|nr:hypothetical protein NQ317_005804 [Molorchus minor]